MKMRVRRNIDRFSDSTKVSISRQILMRNRGLVVGAIRQGLVLKGWIRKGHPRYQVSHVDTTNPRINFFVAVGMPVPDAFIAKRQTVGGTVQLLGYLKLHVPMDEREVPERKEEEGEKENE
jgi:hypothetical protein